MKEISVGDTVTLNEDIQAQDTYYQEWFDFEVDQEFTVTRVAKNKLYVRYIDGDDEPRSYWIERSCFVETATSTPGQAPKPKKRLPGRVPQDGGDYLDPNDPRLMWFWDDVAAEASSIGYCDVFDRLANKLNVPGRKRDYDIKRTLNGLAVTITVQARSEKEAKALIDERIK